MLAPYDGLTYVPIVESQNQHQSDVARYLPSTMALNWEQFASLWGFGLLALCLHGCMALVGRLRGSKVPTVGTRSVFEAGIITNLRFYKNAEAVLVEGYTKVWPKMLRNL